MSKQGALISQQEGTGHVQCTLAVYDSWSGLFPSFGFAAELKTISAHLYSWQQAIIELLIFYSAVNEGLRALCLEGQYKSMF